MTNDLDSRRFMTTDGGSRGVAAAVVLVVAKTAVAVVIKRILKICGRPKVVLFRKKHGKTICLVVSAPLDNISHPTNQPSQIFWEKRLTPPPRNDHVVCCDHIPSFVLLNYFETSQPNKIAVNPPLLLLVFNCPG